MKDDKPSRRGFLTSSAALPIVPLAAAAATSEAADTSAEKFQPEEFWRERIEAP